VEGRWPTERRGTAAKVKLGKASFVQIVDHWPVRAHVHEMEKPPEGTDLGDFWVVGSTASLPFVALGSALRWFRGRPQ
jgi:hypothetical protein